MKEYEKFKEEEKNRVPDLDEVLANGLDPDSLDRFADNRGKNIYHPSVESRMLKDPKTVRKLRRIILGHLARSGSLSLNELKMLTGFSHRLIEPLLEERSLWKKEQVSLLVDANGLAPVVKNEGGLFELSETDKIYKRQQAALGKVRDSLTGAMELLESADQIVRLLQGEELIATETGSQIKQTTKLITREDAQAEQLRGVLTEVFDILKKTGIFDDEVTFQSFRTSGLRSKDNFLRRPEGMLFSVLSRAIRRIQEVDQHDGLMWQMRYLSYGFSPIILTELDKGLTNAFSSLREIDIATLRHYYLINDYRTLLELFAEFRQVVSVGERKRSLEVVLSETERRTLQLHESRRNLIDADVPFVDDIANERVDQLEVVETPQEWAVFLEDNVRVPKLIAAELKSLKIKGKVDVVEVIDNLKFSEVTSSVASEARTFLKVRLSNNREEQKASLRRLFDLRDQNAIGSLQYAELGDHGKKLDENPYHAERSNDAIFIEGIFGISPKKLLGTLRLQNITEYQYDNPDIFVDHLIAQLMGEKKLEQDLKREIQILFGQAYAASRAGTVKIMEHRFDLLNNFSDSPMLVVLQINFFIRKRRNL